jgi:uncharacterized protein (TIGR02598 family)
MIFPRNNIARQGEAEARFALLIGLKDLAPREPERAMKRNSKAKGNARNRTGFTLVEVCLAMSIMVFATTAMIGLLSSGLNRLGGSIDANQGQNIAQQVLLEARQMPFPQLAAMGTYKRYFTYEGDMFDSSSAQTVYTANVTVGAPTAMPGGGATSSTLATVTVEIRKTPAGQDAPANPAIAHYVSMSSCRDLTLLVTGS